MKQTAIQVISSIALAVTLTAFLAACGNTTVTPNPVTPPSPPSPPSPPTPPGPPTPPPPPASGTVNTYLTGLPAWNQFSPLRDEYQHANKETNLNTGQIIDKPAQQSEESLNEDVNGVMSALRYACTTTTYTASRNPEQLALFDLDRDALFVGALLQGRDYKLGSLKLLPIAERAPINIGVTLQNGQNIARTVQPTATAVNQAVGKIIEDAKNAGTNIAGRVSFDGKITNSLIEAGLEFGGSVKYAKLVEAERNFKASYSGSTQTFVFYYIQNAYTVFMDQPASPAAFFTDAFTKAKLDDLVARGLVGPDNLPTYVSSISYGRVFRLQGTIKGSRAALETLFRANFDVSKISGSVSLKTYYNQVRDSLQLKAFGVGSSGAVDQAITAALKNGGKQAVVDYLNTRVAVDEYVPISFSVRNLGDGSLARISDTLNYEVKQCTPVNSGDYIVTLLELRNIQGFRSFAALNGSLTMMDKNVWTAQQSAPVNKNDGTSMQLSPGDPTEGVDGANAQAVIKLVQGGRPVSIVGRVYDWSDSVNKNFRVFEQNLEVSTSTPLNQFIEVQDYSECVGRPPFPRRDTCGATLVYKVEKVD
jgi:hypothetical protein